MDAVNIKKQIVYLPYFNMKETEEIDLGFVKIWNFDKKAEEYIPDEKLRAKIKALLDTNVFSNNNLIKNIGVIQFANNKEFNILVKKKLNQIEEIRALLFLAFMSKNVAMYRGANAGHFMMTSENFIVTIQNFETEEDFIGEQSGFIVQINSGGHQIGEHKFYAPSYLTQPMQFNYNPRFLQVLIGLRSKQKRLYSKIIRSIGLFLESYYNDHQISRNARILLQCSAFETLLDLPEWGQRKEFKEIIKRETVEMGEKDITYWYETRNGKRQDKKPLNVIWADRFYVLRNHIIHGNKINASEFSFKNKQRHMDIAILFFFLLIKKEISNKLRKKIFYDKIIWKKEEDEYCPYEGFEYDEGELEYSLYKSLRQKSLD